jgi:cytochrome P450
MKAGIINLFVGGSETTSNTLNWTLFYLAKNQELQKRAVEEILAVVGKDRLPSLLDRPRTPLVEAIVMETHRLSGLSFFGIPRGVTKDTTLGEYFLPKVY